MQRTSQILYENVFAGVSFQNFSEKETLSSTFYYELCEVFVRTHSKESLYNNDYVFIYAQY